MTDVLQRLDATASPIDHEDIRSVTYNLGPLVWKGKVFLQYALLSQHLALVLQYAEQVSSIGLIYVFMERRQYLIPIYNTKNLTAHFRIFSYPLRGNYVRKRWLRGMRTQRTPY